MQTHTRTPETPGGSLTSLHRRRFFLLFTFLLASLALYPYAEASHPLFYAFRIAGAAAIVLSVYATSLRRSLLIVVALLAIPALLQRVLLPHEAGGAFSIFNVILSLAFDVVVISTIFRRVFAEADPGSETLFGALCVYLLVGFSFSSLYSIIGSLQPHAFLLDPVTNAHLTPDRFDFVYYSFATMTALGSNSIIAVSPEVRSISLLEVLLGILYIAVLIARLIGSYRSQDPTDRNGS